VRIAEVRIAGDSLLRFDDESVTPPYRAALRFDRARIADLDSTRPGHASPLEISGRLGEYGTIELHGHIEPFAARLTLDMEGRIANLDIPPLSSYTARQLGYNLTSGQLDAEVKLRIVNGELQSENRLVLNNIDVKPEDPGRMQGLTHQLSVPLETALSLLRDEHNDIRLQLPVSGDITSPAFDMSDAVNQAVGNAMKTAAVGILKLALQPYGALATIAELAGEAASRVRLEPVTFGAGETSPAPAAGPYLDRIAGLMRERPGLRIRLCGWATPADRTRLAAETAAKTEMPAPEAEADTQSSGPLAAAAAASTTPVPPPEISDEDLQALARRRAETVKPRLVERHGIAAERLFVCHPEIDSGPGALPRVELLI